MKLVKVFLCEYQPEKNRRNKQYRPMLRSGKNLLKSLTERPLPVELYVVNDACRSCALFLVLMNAKLYPVFLLCIVALCVFPQEGLACSTFCLDAENGPIFGKNYDWRVEDGLIVVNKRNVAKIAAMGMPGASWVSKYGSITFNQYGREFAHGGINEAGLVLELMWLDETQYPKDDERPEIDNLQWIQYQLDNFSTVEEVIASDTQLRIISNGALIHYLACDLSGTCATIEFLDGKMQIHSGEMLPFKVLTNDIYTRSLKSAQQRTGLGGALPVGSSRSSLDRFDRAALWLENYDTSSISESAVDYAFTVLEDLSQGDYTKWSIVYDMARRRVYFHTWLNPQIRYFELSNFDFSCQTPVKVLDINAEGAGDVSQSFVDYTWRINRDLLENSFRKTDFLADIPAEALDLTTNYVDTTSCQTP